MNTPKRPAVNRINTVIDCGDAQIMAEFYSRLLGWELTLPAANGWAAVTSPEGAVFAFQEIEGYEPPVWPWEKGKQGQMIHLDSGWTIWRKALSLPWPAGLLKRLSSFLRPPAPYSTLRDIRSVLILMERNPDFNS